MAFADLFNLGYCNNANIKGAGLGTCTFDINRIKALWVFDYNYQFATDFDPTLANYLAMVRKGELKPLQNAVNATWETAEDGTQTFAGGAKRTTDKMPYEFTVFFPNGRYFDQALRGVEKKQRMGIAFVDVDNQIWMFKDANSIITPMNVSFFQVAPYKPQGDEAAGTMVRIQIEDRALFDNNLVALDQQTYNFDPAKVIDVIDTTFEIPGAVTGNNFVFKVKRNADQHAQSGVVAGLIRVTQNGTVVPGTVAENTPAGSGEYTFTRTTGTFTATQTAAVNFYDATTNTNTASIMGVLLKGTGATKVIT